MSRAEDRAEVDKALAGDQDAYSRLYYKLLPKAMQIARSILRNYYDEEHAHDAVTHMLLRIDQYKGTASFMTWAHRGIINKTLMIYRSCKTNKAQISLDAPLEFPDGSTATFVDMVVDNRNRYAYVDARVDLHKLMKYIPVGMRDVLIEKEILGNSMKDIAARRNKDLGTIKSQRFKGIAKLRDAFEYPASVTIIDPTYKMPEGDICH